MIPRWVALAMAISAVASLLVACGDLRPFTEPAPAQCGFPVGVPFSYDADTTLGEVALGHFGGDHVEVRAWITDVAVPFEDPRAQEIVDTRLICVEVIDQDVAVPNPYLTVPFPATP